MVGFIKRYWDIIGGIVASMVVSVAADFRLETIQLCYSIAILMIVCIGLLRVFKKEEDKFHHNEREPNVVDAIIDTQKPIKALNIAEVPTQEGENLGRKIVELWRVMTPIMEKIKTFFSKFKGYIATTAFAILTIVEMCGGFVNDAFGGALTINGVEVLPIVTLACTVVLGVLSNGYTKDEQAKIKALFSKTNTNGIVKEEIKKTIKEKSAQLAQFNKALVVMTHERANLEAELEALTNKLQAKKEMRAMVPQLATDEDVQLAHNEVVKCQELITARVAEIKKTEATIDLLTTTIGALRAQL